MKKINLILTISIFIKVFLFTSCKENEYKVGEIITPTNLSISVEVVGTDDANPNGDGSGFVTFTATADSEINYQFDFGDGKKNIAPSGVITHRYTKVGVNTFTVIVNATGTAGVGTSKSLEVTVYSSFKDVETENFLTGSSSESDVGSSKKWYWQADKNAHVTLGPYEDDYGNGEFAYGAWWNIIKPWDAEKSCMYDNEFVFTRTADGITFEQTTGPAFVPGAYASEIGIEGDQCHNNTVVTTMFGTKNVSFLPSSSKAAIEGSYNNEPYKGTTFEISDGGFMGWYVGSSTYDIISVSENELIVRIIQVGSPYSNGGYAWYHKFTSKKPVKGPNYQYNTLVWEDDFNTDGAPDATKWTYDTGSGGWGNNEVQTYTNSLDNAKVEGGSLIITAKSNGAGGYTSARLKTENLYEFKYGRVEVRAKLPSSQGTWPAIWMLGANFDTVSWPHCGEIDIMEQTGSDKNKVLGTVHWYNTAGSNNASDGSNTAITGASTEFHLYTLEWSEEAIKVYLDDVKYYEITNNSDLPFNADFFMILNIAMGGTLGGAIDPSFTEDTMEIDYIKVYK